MPGKLDSVVLSGEFKGKLRTMTVNGELGTLTIIGGH